MSNYKLSIVAAVYNLEKYLPRCLDALVNQTLQEIEILCVDDGSTDSAPQIIDEYAKKYPNKVKAFHKTNGGEFTTRNYGLERATGEYVTFVDTDDYVEKTWAEKLYNVAKENDADMAVCGFERIDLNTNKVVSQNMTNFGRVVKTIDGKNDGQIANLATTMEYSVDQTSWIACTGTTLTQLSDGDYYVRYKETNNYYASPSTKVVVAKGVAPSTTGEQTTTEESTTTENQTTGEQATTQQTFVEQPDGATTQAGAPKTTETSKKTDKTVSTGDAYPIAIMITLMLGAGVGITGMIRRRKEK